MYIEGPRTRASIANFAFQLWIWPYIMSKNDNGKTSDWTEGGLLRIRDENTINTNDELVVVNSSWLCPHPPQSGLWNDPLNNGLRKSRQNQVQRSTCGRRNPGLGVFQCRLVVAYTLWAIVRRYCKTPHLLQVMRSVGHHIVNTWMPLARTKAGQNRYMLSARNQHNLKLTYSNISFWRLLVVPFDGEIYW